MIVRDAQRNLEYRGRNKWAPDVLTLRYCYPDLNRKRDRKKRDLVSQVGKKRDVEVEEVDAVKSGYGAGSVLIVEEGEVRWKATYGDAIEFLEKAIEHGEPLLRAIVEETEGPFHV